MKLFTGYWAFSLGLILTAATANAQTAPPQESGGAYHAVSDFYGPLWCRAPGTPALRRRAASGSALRAAASSSTLCGRAVARGL